MTSSVSFQYVTSPVLVEQKSRKMLPLILKAIQEHGQQVNTIEGLLDQLRQGTTKPEPELESQVLLALAEGQRTGLVSVQSGRVKPLCKLDLPEEPRSFSCHLLLLNSDPQQAPITAGSSRRASTLMDNVGSEEEPCDCPNRRSSPHWLRPRRSDVTYDEIKLIRQVFSRRELGPEWNVSGTTLAADGMRRARRRSTARMQTRRQSRGRPASRRRSSRSGSRARR